MGSAPVDAARGPSSLRARKLPEEVRSVTEPGDYDEFGLLSQNADEAGLVLDREPVVTRRAFALGARPTGSAIVWGGAQPRPGPPPGGGPNAPTPGTVGL